MRSALPANEIEALTASAQLLGDLDTLDPVPSFAGNRVFRATTARGPKFVKFGEPQAITLEHAVLRIADEHGVPVPAVVVADPDGRITGHACLVLREVAGMPLTGDEPLFNEAAALLQRLHSVRCNGFGSLAVMDDGSLQGQDGSWCDALRRRVESATPVAAASLVPIGLVERVANAVEKISVSVSVATSAQLLHGDFHPRHVYADSTGVTAIIDWGDATAGDPDYDLARVLHSVVSRRDVAAAVDVARRILPKAGEPLDSALLSRLLTYAAVFVLWSMRSEFDAGAPWPPWWPMQTQVLERILDALHHR